LKPALNKVENKLITSLNLMASSHNLLVIADDLKTEHAGTERQMLFLLNFLVTQDCDVHLVLLRPTPFSVRWTANFPVTHLPGGRMSSPRLWWSLMRLAWKLRGRGFSTALTFFNDASIVAPPLLRLLGYRTFVSRRDMGWWCRGAVRICTRIVRPFVERWIVNSDAVRRATVELEGCRAETIEIIPNAVVIPDPLPPVSANDLSSAELRIGVLANVTRHKRIHDIVAAVAGLRRRNLDVTLEIAGSLAKEPATVEELRAQIAALDLSSRVTLLGEVRDVRSFLARTHIVVLASESEGLSNAILESMAHGRVLVCSAADGNRELVTDGVTGRLFGVGDVAALEASIAECRAKPAVAAEFAAAAQRKVLDSYSLDAGMRHWMRTLFQR
jgi:L-malate glycosyltransferase